MMVSAKVVGKKKRKITAQAWSNIDHESEL